jgi:putative glycosyltransferase (TIGR04372 family)
MIYKLLNKLNKLKKFKYYFLTTLPYSFGDSCEQITLANINIKLETTFKKAIIIVTPTIFPKILKYHLCNNYLFNNIIIENNDQNNFRKIKSFVLFFLNIEFLIKRLTALFLKYFFNIVLKERFFFPQIGIPKYFLKYKNSVELKFPTFSFSESKIDLQKEIKEKCYNQLLRYGVEKQSKFICLHVRDAKYRNDYNRRTFRNSKVDNYNDLMKFLIDKDYFVFRIGRLANDKIKIKNKKIIDYPFSDLKSDYMDLFLIKECFYFIGNLSGPLECATMFNKPCFITDSTRVFEAPPRHKMSRSIFRDIIRKKNSEKVRFRDYIDMHINYHHWRFINDELDFLPNSSNQLLEEIKLFDREFNNKEFKDINKTQIIFNEYLYKSLFKKYSQLTKESDKQFCQKLIFNLKNIKGSFSLNFLKKNGFD